MVAHGITLVTLFGALHECIHRTAFRGRWANDLIAALIGVILVLPANFYRHFHFAHHRYSQDSANDPELNTPKPTSILNYFIYLTTFLYWRDRSSELLRHILGQVTAKFVPINRRAAIRREAQLHCIIYTVIAVLILSGITYLPLTIWILPIVIGQPFLRAYLIAEHTGCEGSPHMFRNTRTTFTIAPIRFFMWNMPYHAEHHAFPGLPFHALPKAHRLLSNKLEVTANGYVPFHLNYVKALIAGQGRVFVTPTQK